jgi:hypothetical protein
MKNADKKAISKSYYAVDKHRIGFPPEWKRLLTQI